MAKSSHVLIGGTNDGRRLSFHGVTVQVAVLDPIPAAPSYAREMDAPMRTEIYRLESVGTSGRNRVVLCLHESLGVHEGLLRLLDGYNPQSEA